MTPPISKDWWLAAALSTAALPTTMAQAPSASANRTGVVTAVAPGGTVTGNNEVMVVGSSVLPGQRLRTDANGQLHLLFLDQSALTLGPDSELTIDEFRFDPATRQGQIRLGLAKGVVRVVGGQISKNTATVIATPHGKLELLGGIALAETNSDRTSGIFLFGQQMRATSNSGDTTTVTRPGFGVDLSGTSMSTPRPPPTSDLNALLNRLESRPTNTGNANPPPAPAGQLLSTGNRPGGASNPGSTLANDRLKNVVDVNTGSSPSLTLRDLLGSSQVLQVS
ncbi:FecR domain-containing protein [Hydrogenophaga sp. YM1]|uniref:FecR family protein n=1 Tax=Hydrogenophaga TaxID=47420 RepID=UPI00195D56DC|nr:FecR domain-containing protein [Hydrogenophaga sp. YM1]QRR32304.1 FecR domain-containing protein [Hydrogenophaga sp. YM1]